MARGNTNKQTYGRWPIIVQNATIPRPAYPKWKSAASDRTPPPKKQRVNHVAQASYNSDTAYAIAASSAAGNVMSRTMPFWSMTMTPLIREKILLPIIRRRVAGIDMKLLVDTGAVNFIQPLKWLKGSIRFMASLQSQKNVSCPSSTLKRPSLYYQTWLRLTRSLV